MKVKTDKNLLVVGTVLIVCLILVGFSSSIRGGEDSYEIRPYISLPEYRTDTGRAIDAYERMMERFISMTEKNLGGINADTKDISKKLVLIDFKLTELSMKMARIEKAIGIEQTKPQTKKKPPCKSDLEKSPKKTSCSMSN